MPEDQQPSEPYRPSEGDEAEAEERRRNAPENRTPPPTGVEAVDHFIALSAKYTPIVHDPSSDRWAFMASNYARLAEVALRAHCANLDAG